MPCKPLHADPSLVALAARRYRARRKLLSQGVKESDLPAHLQKQLHFCPNRIGRKCNCERKLAQAGAFDSLVEIASNESQLQKDSNLQLEAAHSRRPRESVSFMFQQSFNDPSTENSPVNGVSGDLFQVLSGSKESTASSFFEWTENSLRDARAKLDDGGVHQLNLRLKLQSALQALCPGMALPEKSVPDEPPSSETLSVVVKCCKTGCDQGFKLVSEPAQVSEEGLNERIVGRLVHSKNTLKKRKDKIMKGK